MRVLSLLLLLMMLPLANAHAPAQASRAGVTSLTHFHTSTFDASGVWAPVNGRPYTSYWNFKDGTTACGDHAQHTFAASQVYRIQLMAIATNCDPNTIDSSRTLLHSFETTTNHPPVASWSYTTQGLHVNFDASTTSDPEGHSLLLFWNFGDSTQGREAMAGHDYTQAGCYNVVLAASDSDGASSYIPAVKLCVSEAGTTSGSGTSAPPSQGPAPGPETSTTGASSPTSQTSTTPTSASTTTGSSSSSASSNSGTTTSSLTATAATKNHIATSTATSQKASICISSPHDDASLEVTHLPSGAVLRWNPQNCSSLAYQVWRKTDQWTLVKTLNPDQAAANGTFEFQDSVDGDSYQITAVDAAGTVLVSPATTNMTSNLATAAARGHVKEAGFLGLAPVLIIIGLLRLRRRLP